MFKTQCRFFVIYTTVISAFTETRQVGPVHIFVDQWVFLQLHVSFIMNVSHCWIPYQIHKFLQSVLSLRCCLKILIFLVSSWFSLSFFIVSYIKNVFHWFLRVLSCNVISPVMLCKRFHFLFCFSPQPYLLKRFLTTRRFNTTFSYVSFTDPAHPMWVWMPGYESMSSLNCLQVVHWPDHLLIVLYQRENTTLVSLNCFFSYILTNLYIVFLT